MSTHNIGFYEDLTKIIFELSSNIIKYAPYFFCWLIKGTRSWCMVEECVKDNYYARVHTHSYHCCREMHIISRLYLNFLDNTKF